MAGGTIRPSHPTTIRLAHQRAAGSEVSVYQAAERLEFVEERPSRFNRFRRHAAVAALAAGASVSLGVAASSVAPVLRASTTARVREAGSTLGDEGAWRRVLAGECATELDAKAQAGRMSQTLASADAQVIPY